MRSTTSSTTAPVGGTGWRVFTEDWDPAFGNPATFDLDDSDRVEQAEAGDGPVGPVAPPAMPLCFVDGTRRVELSLWLEHPVSGSRIPGLAGAYAVGAVTIRPGGRAAFEGIRVGRRAIWGGGHTGTIDASTGHRWASTSTTVTEPALLLAELEDLMRAAEGDLALDAAASGWNVVLDGPLNHIRSLHTQVTGYVKRHRRQLLAPDAHAKVPDLEVGARTRLHTAGNDRYTCYVRVGHPGPGGSPWGGIARLEFAAAAGLDHVVRHATGLASLLPRYAGVAHRDQRAPVNLTPVKNLETRLARELGRGALATRAARDAVIAGRVA
jgi:hypothetical protein